MGHLGAPPAMRYILADELHCFPPDAVQEALDARGVTYVQLLERVASMLASRPGLFFQEVAKSLPSYWSVYVKDQYPEEVKAKLLHTIEAPGPECLQLWETLAPYVLKKAVTLAVETVVYERQEWVLAVLNRWDSVGAQLDDAPKDVAKRPMLGMLMEAERWLNKVQLLAVAAAQSDAAAKGAPKPFGEMAIQLGFLTPERLQEGLAIQKDIAVALDSPKRLGYYLLEAGAIAPSQLREALKNQKASGFPLGQVLVEQGAIDSALLDTMLQIQRSERISGYLRDQVAS